MDSIYDLRSKRRLFVDKDIRLSDTVRNQPTAATPPQPLPQPPQDKEPAGLAEIRDTFYELNDRVAKLYDDDKDKAITKDIRCDVLGGKHVRFRARDSDKGRIGDLIRRLRREFEKARLGVDVFEFNDQTTRIHPAVNQFLFDVVSLVVESGSLASLVLGGQCAEDRDGSRALVELIRFCVRQARGQRCYEHYTALHYPAETDPRPLLEEEHRLVAENDTEDWTPTTDSRRRQMFRALDRVFYKTLIDKYLVPETLAAVPLPNFIFEVVENVVANKRIADLEALVHGRTSGMSKPTTKRLGGMRPGLGDPERRVAFDPKDKKAKPPCPRCGPGHFHGWWQCPAGGAKPGPDGGSQGCVHAPTKREVKTLALCKMFDDAAEQGPLAFEACMRRFGEPALLEGERVLPDSQRDISAFGFAVGGDAQQAHWEGGSSDDEDAEAELSFQQVSILPDAPQTSSDMPQGHAGGKISISHAQLGQPGQPQKVVHPAGGAAGGAAAAGGAYVRWRDRQAVGPLYACGDGLHYPLFARGPEVESAPLSANALAIAAGADEDYDNSEADEEFDKEAATFRAACASEEVVAAAPAVGGRACGVGQSALAKHYPKWLLVCTMLLCVTAVGALRVTGASRPGGAFPVGLDLGMPLERPRVRLVAGEVMAAYRQGFLAALQLRDSPETVPGAGDMAARDAPRAVVQPPGGEAQDLRWVHAELGHLRLRDAPLRLDLVVWPRGGATHNPPLDGAQRGRAAGDEDEDEDAAAAGAEPADTYI
ncbi:hypothetical protein CYMTET_30849 [Cymbomonas tetramitiformis]|uniref:Uncharacterized protein n=1 Tax=Cymbomonas tetramitiformis TaxID=36881 RepID=A0AAE0KTH4_9CHLO|nr:hypothetical protein CYMTET_30849 [Cymbomonas tetramitiformis]